jgi:peptidoglycan/LPS O-acetylase OafA/YrhL
VAETDWLRRGRIPCLDGVRAIAVALVLLAHARRTVGWPAGALAPLDAAGRVGHVGVEAFFVLSGFLITTLMLREIDRTDRLDLRAFYWRRVLRIVPAYAALLGVVAGMQLAGLADVPPRDWLLAGTYSINFVRRPAWELGHAWSLSIEEHFYLLWPLAIVLLPARLRFRSAMAAAAASFVGRWIVLIAFPRWTAMAELWTFTRLDAIACGCALSLVAWSPRGRATLDRLAARNVLVAGAVALLAASLYASTRSAKVAVGVSYAVNAACIAFLVWAAAARPRSVVGRLLELRPVVLVGVLSYSLYLWQQLFLHPFRHDWTTRFPQNLVITVLVAWASYRFVESSYLRIKERAGSCREPHRAGSPARCAPALCDVAGKAASARQPPVSTRIASASSRTAATLERSQLTRSV